MYIRRAKETFNLNVRAPHPPASFLSFVKERSNHNVYHMYVTLFVHFASQKTQFKRLTDCAEKWQNDKSYQNPPMVPI